MRSTGSAVPIVQPVYRAWGKLSWDLSETTWKSNGAPSDGRAGEAQGVMPRAKRSPAEDRGDAVPIIERLHRASFGRSAMCR
jgi:hypothetical protein